MIRLTNPDKPLYPAAVHVTKQRLVDYWRRVAPFALPHIAGRPLSLLRCPNGAAQDCFFQRHHRRGLPLGLRPAPIGTEEFLVIDDLSGLEGAAQMDALELHIWGVHVEALERPDRLVFDLDPDPSVSFEEVKRAARDFRALLEAAGLASFALLTGGKGMHVVAPIDAALGWPTFTGFAKGVATRLAAADPSRFTAMASKARRVGRIYIDYRRNERGASAVAPFSPRARETPAVATPVSWEELGRIERADCYCLDKMERRLAALRADPWPGYFNLRQGVSPAALRMFAGAGL
ncbi:Multifunctional+non-homologous+end+joining+protein+LigD [Methylocapsa aurea]|uniref:non-homologous end-joining DNA ligase n=1 Tax=Methylocapsa aurea TaxID=663610 RepID=UPI003D18D5DB